MSIILSTSRLTLREFVLSDAQAFYDLNSDWDVMKYTGDVAFKNVHESENLIRNYSDYQKNGFGRNTVVLNETQEIIGWCGLKKHKDGKIDIGYRFFKTHWNKGYATESARAIMDHGFKNYSLEEIVGNASADNIGSIRVFEKLGMKYIGKQDYDGIDNSVQYHILKADFYTAFPAT